MTLEQLQKEAREEFIKVAGNKPESDFLVLDSITRKAYLHGIRDVKEALPQSWNDSDGHTDMYREKALEAITRLEEKNV